MNEDKNPEIEPDKDTGFGNLLKTEREKKGLSISQVSEVTKLRKHFVEALENEEWEKLPSRVFIKGFIRSYALSLGLDLREVMRLFEKIAPQEKEQDFSNPLIIAEKSKSKILYLLIPLIVILAIVFYLLWGWYWKTTDAGEPEIISNSIEGRPDTAGNKIIQKQPGTDSREDSIIEEINQKPETTEPDLHGVAVVDSTGNNFQAVIKTEDYNEDIDGDSEKENKITELQYLPLKGIGEDEDLLEERSINDSEYVLTGIVSMRTYIKIYVDDNPPKEYIFRPGSRPQWAGEKGFYAVVGNAAGIEFDFNGTAFKDLGKSGMVRDIRFPGDFKSRWEE